MAVNNFSTDLWVFTINGRVMSDWGEQDPPYNDEPIDQKSTLRRGQGGNATRLDRINPGRRQTVYFNPGGDDASFMQGLMNSNAVITCSAVQIGTLESAVGTEGVIVNDTANGRGGQNITDSGFIIEYNTWTQLK